MPTVAIIVIGNEILSGKFADENGPYLIRRLRALGADLRRIVTIPDTLDDIAVEVRSCSERYDAVITSGGVGPTHDDLTFDGVARAFGLTLEPLQPLIALLERYNLPTTGANLRVASPPQGTELVTCDHEPFPVIRVRNVYVLPGVPKLLRSKFEVIAPLFQGDEIRAARLYIDEPECDIADALTAIAANHPSVDIGSYPRWGEPGYQVILTLESRDEAALMAATAALDCRFRVVAPPAVPG